MLEDENRTSNIKMLPEKPDRTVLLCVQGTAQLLAAITASRYSEKCASHNQVEYILVVYDLFAEHRNEAFVESIFKLADSWIFKTKIFLDSDRIKKIVRSSQSQAKKNYQLHQILGFSQVDEIYLCRNYIGLGSLLLLNAYSSAKKITYGDGYGVVSSQDFFERNQYQTHQKKPYLRLLYFLKKSLKELISNFLKWDQPFTEFDSAYLTIPIDYCGQYLAKIQHQFVPISSLKEVLSIAINNIERDFKKYIEKELQFRKVSLLLLTSTLTESKYTLLQNEVEFYVRSVKNNAQPGMLVVIKEHPRSSSNAVLETKEQLIRMGYDVVILGDRAFNFIPIELSIRLINPELVVSFGSSSSISLALLYKIKQITIHPEDLIKQYFLPEVVESTLDFQIVISECLARIENGWMGNSVLWSRPYPYRMNDVVYTKPNPDMNRILCPLSKSENIEKLEDIIVDDIKRLYLRDLKINLESEIVGIHSIGLYRCLDSDLVFFSPAITGSEVFYEMLQPRHGYYMEQKDEYHYACQWIRPTDHVLEIGCGKAAFSDYLPTSHYSGLEFSQKAIEMAQSKGRTVYLESIQNHSIHSSEKYDVVCAFQVLEHVSEVDEFIRASIACLKPNGILIYSTPSLDSFIRKIPNFALDMPPHHVTRWTDQALKNVANYYPLECVEIWHEPLQTMHKKLYLEIIFMSAFSRRLHRSFQIIDFRIGTQLLTLISRFFARLAMPGLTDENYLPAGTTVVSVYRKI